MHLPLAESSVISTELSISEKLGYMFRIMGITGSVNQTGFNVVPDRRRRRRRRGDAASGIRALLLLRSQPP